MYNTWSMFKRITLNKTIWFTIKHLAVSCVSFRCVLQHDLTPHYNLFQKKAIEEKTKNQKYVFPVTDFESASFTLLIPTSKELWTLCQLSYTGLGSKHGIINLLYLLKEWCNSPHLHVLTVDLHPKLVRTYPPIYRVMRCCPIKHLRECYMTRWHYILYDNGKCCVPVWSLLYESSHIVIPFILNHQIFHRDRIKSREQKIFATRFNLKEGREKFL